MLKIKAFPNDGKLRRVEWLGPLQPLRGGGTLPKMHVHLAPVQRSILAGEPAAQIDEVDQAVAQTAAQPQRASLLTTDLPLVKQGSLWAGRTLYRHPDLLRPLTFTVTPKQTSLVDALGETRAAHGVVSIEALLTAHLSELAALRARESFAVAILRAHADYELVLIPCTVLLQACFGTSGYTLACLLHGELHRLVDPRSNFTDPQRLTFLLELRQYLRAEEAPLLATLLADPLAARQYERMRSYLVLQNAKAQTVPGDVGLQVRLGWPFSNPAELQVRGISVPLSESPPGRRAFVVEQIEEISTKLVFDELQIALPREYVSPEGDDEALPIVAMRSKQEVELPEPLQLSDDTPDPVFKERIVPFFGALRPLKLRTRKVTNEQAQRVRMSRLPGAPSRTPGGDGSTARSDQSHESSVAVNTQQEQLPEVPLALDYFLDTLDHLRKLGHAFETIAVTSSHRSHTTRDEVINFYPRDIVGRTSWHMTQDANGLRPRAYVVAQLINTRGWHYLVELERKDTAKLSVAYLQPSRPEPLDPQLICEFMVDLARDGMGWRRGVWFEHGDLDTIRHQVAHGVESFARSIIRHMRLADLADDGLTA